jgi:hypothetical protein
MGGRVVYLELLQQLVLLAVVRLDEGPGRHCSPHHRIIQLRNEGKYEYTLDDVARNICRALS